MISSFFFCVGSSTSVIAGAVVGCVLGLLLIILVVFLLLRYYHRLDVTVFVVSLTESLISRTAEKDCTLLMKAFRILLSAR